MKQIKPLPFEIVVNKETEKVNDYESFAFRITDFCKKGFYIQRYKGLGEMNPEQLWETTLDPETRSLLKVTLNDALITNETFSLLMGEKVEPRRNFISNNALSVGELDI